MSVYVTSRCIHSGCYCQLTSRLPKWGIKCIWSYEEKWGISFWLFVGESKWHFCGCANEILSDFDGFEYERKRFHVERLLYAKNGRNHVLNKSTNWLCSISTCIYDTIVELRDSHWKSSQTFDDMKFTLKVKFLEHQYSLDILVSHR